MINAIACQFVALLCYKATVVEGKERGIADALFVAQGRFKDDQGRPMIDDVSIEMALTDIVNGGVYVTISHQNVIGYYYVFALKICNTLPHGDVEKQLLR